MQTFQGTTVMKHFLLLWLLHCSVKCLNFEELHLADQYIPDQHRRFKSRISNDLPLISGLFCDVKDDTVEYSGMKITNIKLCRAENVCWNMKDRRLEMSHLVLPQSLLPDSSEAYFTNLSGMRDNLFVAWSPHIFSLTRPKDLRVAWIEEPSLLMKRYLAVNTMHLFHDEVLPSLATILHHKALRAANEERLIVTLDDIGPTRNDELLEWLGQLWRLNNLQATLRMRHGFKPHEHLDYICFNKSFIGMDSPSTSWYQYGFDGPQGPIKSIDRQLVGKNVRTAVEWIKDELFGLENKLIGSEVESLLKNLFKTPPEITTKPRALISIVSRKLSRLILNENELKASLERSLPSVRIQFIQQETMSIEDLIEEISKSIVLIGMHGALLALSAFLPPKALLIEMFPFGIPAENYTPYKTLAGFPEMDLKYAAWTNPREEAPFNVGHVDRKLIEGGLQGFPESYISGILSTKTVPSHQCCYSPFWLYRIFQDTRVDPEAIINIIIKYSVL